MPTCGLDNPFLHSHTLQMWWNALQIKLEHPAFHTAEMGDWSSIWIMNLWLVHIWTPLPFQSVHIVSGDSGKSSNGLQSTFKFKANITNCPNGILGLQYMDYESLTCSHMNTLVSNPSFAWSFRTKNVHWFAPLNQAATNRPHNNNIIGSLCNYNLIGYLFNPTEVFMNRF